MKQGLEHLKKLAIEQAKKDYPSCPAHALPKTSYLDKTANGLTKCIIDWINLNGGQAERINVISRQVKGKFVKSNMTVGTADISATIPTYHTQDGDIYRIGQSVKIEVKIGKDKQSDAQKKYEKDIVNAGGLYFIAKDFESFYEWYKRTF